MHSYTYSLSCRHIVHYRLCRHIIASHAHQRRLIFQGICDICETRTHSHRRSRSPIQQSLVDILAHISNNWFHTNLWLGK